MQNIEKHTREIAKQAEEIMLGQLEQVITNRIEPKIKEMCRQVLKEEGIIK